MHPQVSVPQAPQKVNCTVCSSSSVINAPPTSGVWTLRQGRFHTLSLGWSPLEKNGPWAATSPPMSLDVSWAEPRSTQQTSVLCDGTAHCQFIFLCFVMEWHTAWVGPVVHRGKVIRFANVFSPKGITFCMTLWPTLCLLMVLSLCHLP